MAPSNVGLASCSGLGALASGKPASDGARMTRPRVQDVVAPKNLLGVPWRVAFTLQERGWPPQRHRVGQDQPGARVSARPAVDHLRRAAVPAHPLTRYWFDLDPVRIPLACPEARDGTRVIGGARNGRHGGVDSTARTRGGGVGAPSAASTPLGPLSRRARAPGTCAAPGHSTPPRTRAAATPATCGACRPARTTGRMSPRSR